MEEALLSLLSLLIYLSLFIIVIGYILKAGLRDWREAGQKLREKGLTWKDAFFRFRPYHFWPKSPVPIVEAFKRGAVFSTFIFSLTGVLGTLLGSLGVSRTPFYIFCVAITSGLISFPLAAIIFYANQLALRKFGDPVKPSEQS